MGFNPNPSLGIGKIKLNGFELKKRKDKNPSIRIF